MLEELLQKIEGNALPKWEDMPDLDLYMDQVISLVGRYLKNAGIDDEKLLTDSMVNNYVKMKVIPAPVGKRYNRNHVACLIMICISKSIVPINSMKNFNQYTDSEEKIKADYENFTKVFVSANKDVTDSLRKVGEGNSNKTLYAVLRAATEQRIALNMLNDSKED